MVVRWWGWWLVKDLVMRQWRWWLVRDLVVRWRRWWLVRDLIQRSFLSLLLLTENGEGVLYLSELRSLSVNVLLVGLDVLDCNLSSQDGFLFLPEPLNFLLDSGQFLLLCCYFIFLGFFIPIMVLDLIELCVSLSHACW
jgi:hypothetical protein